MNRKTSVSIILTSLILIVGVGALTLFVYLPKKKAQQNKSDVLGAKTTSTLETTTAYLTTQVGVVKELERLIRNSGPVYSDRENSQYTLDDQRKTADSARQKLLAFKVQAQGWVIPAEAGEVQALFQKVLDQELAVSDSYQKAFNQITSNAQEAQFTLVESARLRAESEKLVAGLKTKNGELLKNTGVAFTDSDGDTLPDVWERIAGSDQTLVDTDDDGLLDGEEFNLYLTKPYEPDTDADGFSDGQEITNGFNPIGLGKLTPSVTN
ncbi:MAG: hypothetical protein WC497_03125 [Patescibacteria group bacterium]